MIFLRCRNENPHPPPLSPSSSFSVRLLNLYWWCDVSRPRSVLCNIDRAMSDDVSRTDGHAGTSLLLSLSLIESHHLIATSEKVEIVVVVVELTSWTVICFIFFVESLLSSLFICAFSVVDSPSIGNRILFYIIWID